MTDTHTLKDVLEAFNAHDLDRIMAFFADDCMLDMPRGSEPWGTRFVGREAVRAGLGGSVSRACQTCTTATTNTGSVATMPSPGAC